MREADDAFREVRSLFHCTVEQRMGRRPGCVAPVLLDVRPEATERFGTGLRAGMRVRSRTGDMTVLGVKARVEDGSPSLVLLPDGWYGGTILYSGVVDLWQQHIRPVP